MSKKLCKKHAIILQKVVKNRCQNHQKTIQKSMRKKGQEKEGKTLFARGGPGSGKRNKKAYSTSTRHIQRETNLDPSTRLGRLRARSGYIGPTGDSGYPAFWHCKLRGLTGRPPAPGIRGPFSTFRWPIFSLPTSIFWTPV